MTLAYRVTLAYRLLLRLYPHDHRACFDDEMRSVFDQANQEHHSRGWTAYLRFLAAECGGLIVGLATAWALKIAGRGYVHDQRQIRTADVAPLPHEVQEAQDRLTANLNGLLHAISHHQFVKARAYAAEEQKAREDLRLLRERYNITESGGLV
jgi:hypothetical protein